MYKLFINDEIPKRFSEISSYVLYYNHSRHTADYHSECKNLDKIPQHFTPSLTDPTHLREHYRELSDYLHVYLFLITINMKGDKV